MIKKSTFKDRVTPANTHDSTAFLPVLHKIIEEHPEVQIGNLNGDNRYLSDDNFDALYEHGIINNIAFRKKNPRKILKN